jgi:uncharacterized protein (DUF736 family)
MIIGNFKKQAKGYAGDLITLTHQAKLVFTPKGVDDEVTLDGIKLGAAWKKTARESGKDYLSVQLDSPFLPAPVNCALMPQNDGNHIPVWSRDDRRQD